MVRRLALLAAATYATAFVVWRLALQSPLLEEHWQLQVSQLLGAWAIAPLLVLLPLALLSRSKWALAAVAAPALLFMTEYGGQFLPHWRPLYADEGSQSLRVMTWNTFMGNGWDQEAIATIWRLDPDIITMQEVGYNMADGLKSDLGDLYPYRIVRLGGSRNSLSILSKHPIVEQELSTLWDSCQCQQVAIDLNGQPITIINVHMWSPTIQFRYGRRNRYYRLPRLAGFDARYQDIAFGQLLERIDQVDGPLLVMGDFNTMEQQPNYGRLHEKLGNVHASVGWGAGYTWPNGIDWWGWRIPPAIRIDHIFYSDDWLPRAIRTGALAKSDHRYVVADLSVER